VGGLRHVAGLFQAIAQRPQTAAHPLLGAHGVASRFGSDQCPERGENQRRFFSTDGRPPPGRRIRSAGWLASEAANSSRPRRMVFSSTPVISNTGDQLRARGAVTNCEVPAPLLLIQPAQQQVHLTVILKVGVLEPRTTHGTLAGSHLSCSHPNCSSSSSRNAAAPTLLSAALVPEEVSQNRKLFFYSPSACSAYRQVRRPFPAPISSTSRPSTCIGC
jgi:hypothetical protein